MRISRPGAEAKRQRWTITTQHFLVGYQLRYAQLGDFLQRFPHKSRLLCGEQMNSKNDAELVHLARTDPALSTLDLGFGLPPAR